MTRKSEYFIQGKEDVQALNSLYGELLGRKHRISSMLRMHQTKVDQNLRWVNTEIRQYVDHVDFDRNHPQPTFIDLSLDLMIDVEKILLKYENMRRYRQQPQLEVVGV